MNKLSNWWRKLWHKKNTPYVSVIAMSTDKVTGQLKVELDWNDAFVEFLRKNEYRGRTDDEIVYKWFNALSQEIGKKFEDMPVGNSEYV